MSVSGAKAGSYGSAPAVIARSLCMHWGPGVVLGQQSLRQ